MQRLLGQHQADLQAAKQAALEAGQERLHSALGQAGPPAPAQLCWCGLWRARVLHAEAREAVVTSSSSSMMMLVLGLHSVRWLAAWKGSGRQPAPLIGCTAEGPTPRLLPRTCTAVCHASVATLPPTTAKCPLSCTPEIPKRAPLGKPCRQP